ncbi:MAG: class I tRNA ligase family protein [Candidatus Nealsonbacteria bacterium]
MENSFPELEKKILLFWQKAGIFEKSVKQRANARDFVFFEGPPTANGKPGIHHVLARTFKDVICRYKAMQGFHVVRKAGWDTHGLPVELEVEKKLGLKNKKDIEKYGIAKFNQQCRESVWQYKDEWEKLTERIGFWVDMKDPYITYENDYIESLWWIIKEIHKKKLLYKGYKVVPYCARCGTSLSSHEVALGYKKVKEPSVYVKFKVKPNTYLLVWTTTPWTLPANVAVAVNPKLIYVKARLGKDNLILAKDRLSCLGEGYEIVEEFLGKNLLKMKYEPLHQIKNLGKKAWFVVGANFVSVEDGTGLVHIAPAFGEDDMAVSQANDLPVILNVDEQGKFKKEVKEWAGQWVKDADPLIIEYLQKKGYLFKKELYEHDYPFCWRCSMPLLYYAKESWFINMQKVKKSLIANNQNINWVPAHLKDGRFGEWLKDLKDWAFSRTRYWGTPLPVWQCQKCEHQEVIGSKKDLMAQEFSTNRYFLLRHGHSLKNVKQIISSRPEKAAYPLLPKGIKQVERVAKFLKKEKIDLIFSSDITRTKQTAKIVSEALGVKIVYSSKLRDIDLGVFNGKSFKEFHKVFNAKDLFHKAPEKGESWPDCRKRMVDFVEQLEKKYKKKNILIVSHGDPLWLLEGAMAGWTDKELWHFKEGHLNYIGTGELRKISYNKFPYNKKMELDFHRPYVDEVKFTCPKCKKGLMERVLDLIDVWFDSGAMPFAQYHYPFEKGLQFPANCICEAIDQTRGWFYTLLAVSTLLGRGTPYKNVISVGHVLDEKGEKMSKSKGNAVDPWNMIEKYGADAVRWYFFTVNQPGDVKLFAENNLAESLRKFIMTFWNSAVFFETYGQKAKMTQPKHVLDKWIVSRLNELIKEVTKKIEVYDAVSAARTLDSFIINDLSLWYIRRSRRRFQRPNSQKELKEASAVLGFLLSTLAKLTAPFVPFISEEIYKKTSLTGPESSVHLTDWPKADEKLINPNLNQKMEKVRIIVAQVLAERSKAGIKVRQPLPELTVADPDLMKEKDLLELLKEEVNVKKISFAEHLKLNMNITPELEEEGMIREIIRQIQEMRKKADLKPTDKVYVRYLGTDKLNQIMARNRTFVLKEGRVKELSSGDRPKQVFDVERTIKVGQHDLWLAIKKL